MTHPGEVKRRCLLCGRGGYRLFTAAGGGAGWICVNKKVCLKRRGEPCLAQHPFDKHARCIRRSGHWAKMHVSLFKSWPRS